MTDEREITAEELKAYENDDTQFGRIMQLAAHTLRKREERIRELEAEILRLRTTETAAAHAIDVLRQTKGLRLIDGEHPMDTVKRIEARRWLEGGEG